MEQRENLDDLSPGTAATAPGHVPSSGVVGGTNTITLPTLWVTDPSLWFIQVENKFRIHRITTEVRKHELLVEALPPQAIAEIRDILVGLPALELVKEKNAPTRKSRRNATTSDGDLKFASCIKRTSMP
ncbi:hypothetical protein HPB50_019679 [Hyalomma asiaticum]|uniref:Uncharacterized protein n=1 Tax=Hyalomma asiaticum TaxID=266040 RepID=A0ACB7TN19_HYAAI|nr:hypothetical protein HPB50_019679 [Hyalomma asiaticum]